MPIPSGDPKTWEYPESFKAPKVPSVVRSGPFLKLVNLGRQRARAALVDRLKEEAAMAGAPPEEVEALVAKGDFKSLWEKLKEWVKDPENLKFLLTLLSLIVSFL